MKILKKLSYNQMENKNKFTSMFIKDLSYF